MTGYLYAQANDGQKLACLWRAVITSLTDGKSDVADFYKVGLCRRLRQFDEYVAKLTLTASVHANGSRDDVQHSFQLQYSTSLYGYGFGFAHLRIILLRSPFFPAHHTRWHLLQSVCRLVCRPHVCIIICGRGAQLLVLGYFRLVLLPFPDQHAQGMVQQMDLPPRNHGVSHTQDYKAMEPNWTKVRWR